MSNKYVSLLTDDEAVSILATCHGGKYYVRDGTQAVAMRLTEVRATEQAVLEKVYTTRKVIAWMYNCDNEKLRGVQMGSTRPDERASWIPLYAD
jgi:hypothetical protein